MPASVPQTTPRLASAALHQLIQPYSVDRNLYPLIVVGIRGYYADMGTSAGNDRGIYDDALFIDSPTVTAAFNGNTDPSRFRAGKGTGVAKGMAVLKPGAWYAHAFGLHRGKYLALCQTKANVTVIRDGDPPYEDTGRFGINIHRGSYSGTSSEGCQTVYPAQWDSFICLASDQAKRFYGSAWKGKVVPYILLDAASVALG